MPNPRVPNFITTQSFLVSIGGREDVFTAASWGGKSWSTESINDGTALTNITVRGTAKCENVTLKKPYDATYDADLINYIEAYCNEAVTITIQPVHLCPTGGSKGEGWSLLGCQPVKIKMPETDRNGSGIAMLELEFTVSSFSINNAVRGSDV